MVLMEKCIVNGEGTHPVFDWLKASLPAPHDDSDSLMGNPLLITWSPVKRSDISWNFEVFDLPRWGAGETLLQEFHHGENRCGHR